MSAGNWTFGYDLNGNQTTRHTGAALDREITYDADNRPIAVTVGGNTVAYLYGPDGSRIKKLFGADATLYLGDDIERDPTGAFSNYLTPDVKRVGGTNHFLQADHQASVRAVTDNTGTLYRASAFEPFGKQVETAINPLTPAESKGYIGERADPESGLTYLHARYYDTSLGRFLQPDWWDVRNRGVGTNRYAYSGNSPINHADPNGHVFAEEASLHAGTRVTTTGGLRIATSGTETRAVRSEAAVRASLAGVTATVNARASAVGVTAAAAAGVAPSLVTSSGSGGSNTSAHGASSGIVTTGSGATRSPSIPLIARLNPLVVFLGVLFWGSELHEDGEFVVTQEKATPVPETVGPGKNAKGSVPAGPTARPTQEQQKAIDELGNEHGCHTCGSDTSGTASGRWVGDHQPPTALREPEEPQVYYPQCLSCSQRQGGYIRGITRED